MFAEINGRMNKWPPATYVKDSIICLSVFSCISVVKLQRQQVWEVNPHSSFALEIPIYSQAREDSLCKFWICSSVPVKHSEESELKDICIRCTTTSTDSVWCRGAVALLRSPPGWWNLPYVLGWDQKPCCLYPGAHSFSSDSFIITTC